MGLLLSTLQGVDKVIGFQSGTLQGVDEVTGFLPSSINGIHEVTGLLLYTIKVYMRSPWLMSQYCIQYISIYNLKSALQTQIYRKYKSIIFILYYIFIIFMFYCVKMPYNVRWYLNTLRKVPVHINCLRIKNKCLQSK